MEPTLRMNLADIMQEYERYEANAAAGLLLSAEDYLNMVDSMLCDMYDYYENTSVSEGDYHDH